MLEELKLETDELLACRICLATDVKLYGIIEHKLNESFIDITGTALSSWDGFPQHVCEVCRVLLRRAAELRARSRRAQDQLKLILLHNHCITTDFIRSVDRPAAGLSLPLVITVCPDPVNCYYEDLIKEETLLSPCQPLLSPSPPPLPSPLPVLSPIPDVAPLSPKLEDDSNDDVALSELLFLATKKENKRYKKKKPVRKLKVMASTSKRQTWDKDSMAMAILAIREKKMGFLKASESFGVPKTTLIRLSKKNDMSLEEVTNFKLGRKATLPAELEVDLAKYVLEMEASGFGLTRKDIKCLAYQLAEKNKLNHNFSKENQSAGRTWLRLFLTRHPDLSFPQPTGTSIARLKGFNKESFSAFYTLLEDAMAKHKYTANNIYNVDETGISVEPSKWPEDLAKKGKMQVAATTSAERGSTVTCVMCMGASGSFVPPMIIFPRKRDHPLLMKGAPPGAIHACHPSGRIQTELFTKWFKHFIQCVKPSETSPVLLILDGHASHTRNIELVDLARENHVQLLSLPHKIQPLERTFMGPLKTFLAEEIRQRVGNKTQAATHYDIAELFGLAYIRAQRAEFAINGFRVTGICPLDRNVFQDHDFIDDSLAIEETVPSNSHNQQAQVINTSLSQIRTIVNEPQSTNDELNAAIERLIHEAAQHPSNPVEPSIIMESRPIAVIESQQQNTILAKSTEQCQPLSESEAQCQIEISVESMDDLFTV